MLVKYAEQKSNLVALGSLADRPERVLSYDLIDEIGGVIRHNPNKLATAYRDLTRKLFSRE